MALRSLCRQLLSVVVVCVAVLVGYILRSPMPLATFFWLAHQPLWYKTTPTPAVPKEMRPLPRPEGELFLTLPDGEQMPANGLGTCCRATAYHDESVRRTILWYLLQGGRHIDTADLYLNHRAIGEGIRMAMRRGVPRSEIFVTTKIPPDFFGTDNAEMWMERVLDELGLEYVDLVLLHSPRRWMGVVGGIDEFKACCGCDSPKECRQQTWRVLSAARDKGLVRNIGTSNFAIHQLDELLYLKLAPIAVNQLQYHPWVPDWEEGIADHCRKHGIHLTAYFSLGGAINRGYTDLVDDIKKIGKTHNASASQVLLRWGLQRGLSVIPGTGNPAHMRQNLDVYGFSLSDTEMERIKEVGQDKDFSSKFMYFKMDPSL